MTTAKTTTSLTDFGTRLFADPERTDAEKISDLEAMRRDADRLTDHGLLVAAECLDPRSRLFLEHVAEEMAAAREWLSYAIERLQREVQGR